MLSAIWTIIRWILGLINTLGTAAFFLVIMATVYSCLIRMREEYPGFKPPKKNNVEMIVGVLPMLIMSVIPGFNWFMVYMIVDSASTFENKIYENLKKSYATEIELWKLKNADET